jgi:hypothetical protein
MRIRSTCAQPTGWPIYHFYCIEPWHCYIWGFWIAECENVKTVTLSFHSHFSLLHTTWILELYACFLSSVCRAVKKHLPFVTVLSLLWQYVMSLTHMLGSYTNILMLPASVFISVLKRCSLKVIWNIEQLYETKHWSLYVYKPLCLYARPFRKPWSLIGVRRWSNVYSLPRCCVFLSS